jgi:hypothetical protein
VCSCAQIDLEEMLMMRTLRDMNLSKLVADDVELFISLLHDIFPNQKDPGARAPHHPAAGARAHACAGVQRSVGMTPRRRLLGR